MQKTVEKRIAIAKRIRTIRSYAIALSQQLDLLAKEIAAIEEMDVRSEIIQSVSGGLGLSPAEFSADVLEARVLKLRVQSKKFYENAAFQLPPPETSREVKVSAHPIITKLPTMQVVEILGSWRNAINTLSDPAKSANHSEAQHLLDAIDAEWVARRQKASDDGYFKWPSSEPGREDWEDATAKWMDVGPLAFMGYHAGKTAGLSTPHRQGILVRIFTGEIPSVFPRKYLQDWGTPSSAQRLRKMATAIAFSLRSKLSTNDPHMYEAIADWATDLQFLHDTYYVGKFGFSWPSVGKLPTRRPPKKSVSTHFHPKVSASKHKGLRAKANTEPMSQLAMVDRLRNLAFLRAAKPSISIGKRKKK